jgi:hypothetical protein
VTAARKSGTTPWAPFVIRPERCVRRLPLSSRSQQCADRGPQRWCMKRPPSASRPAAARQNACCRGSRGGGGSVSTTDPRPAHARCRPGDEARLRCAAHLRPCQQGKVQMTRSAPPENRSTPPRSGAKREHDNERLGRNRPSDALSSLRAGANGSKMRVKTSCWENRVPPSKVRRGLCIRAVWVECGMRSQGLEIGGVATRVGAERRDA